MTKAINGNITNELNNIHKSIKKSGTRKH